MANAPPVVAPAALTPAFVASLKQRLSVSPSEVVQFLEASEYDLIEVMVANNCWTPPPPTPPAATVQGESSFGLIPYFIHNPPAALTDAIDALPTVIKDLINGILAALKRDVPTQIDARNYQNLVTQVEAKGGLVDEDGSLYGVGRYQCLDVEWIWAVFDYLYTIVVHPVPYTFSPPPPIELEGSKTPGRVTIALVSDWGTGPYTVGADTKGPALDVMAQLMSLNPDYVIHLGDVYYAGTPNASITDPKEFLYLPWNEEQANFLNYWPSTVELPAGHSFMLNSNHEMYSGGTGYFNALSQDSRFQGQIDADRKPSSAFVLTYGGWTILALDSAYYDPSPMYMTGSLGGPSGAQAGWIAGLVKGGLDPAKCIVLTHHAPISYDGSALVTYTGSGQPATGLWPELTSVMGADGPAYWYYGHIHNGIVYAPNLKVTGSPCLLRCLGNGALPYGKAWGLASQASSAAVQFYFDTPSASDPTGVRIYNGFVLLTITQDGAIAEQFYQQGAPGSPPTPVWPVNQPAS